MSFVLSHTHWTVVCTVVYTVVRTVVCTLTDRRLAHRSTPLCTSASWCLRSPARSTACPGEGRPVVDIGVQQALSGLGSALFYSFTLLRNLAIIFLAFLLPSSTSSFTSSPLCLHHSSTSHPLSPHRRPLGIDLPRDSPVPSCRSVSLCPCLALPPSSFSLLVKSRSVSRILPTLDNTCPKYSVQYTTHNTHTETNLRNSNSAAFTRETLIPTSAASTPPLAPAPGKPNSTPSDAASRGIFILIPYWHLLTKSQAAGSSTARFRYSTRFTSRLSFFPPSLSPVLLLRSTLVHLSLFAASSSPEQPRSLHLCKLETPFPSRHLASPLDCGSPSQIQCRSTSYTATDLDRQTHDCYLPPSTARPHLLRSKSS